MKERDESLEGLTTERRNSRTMDLDTMSTLEVLETMNREDETVALSIRPHLKEIAQAAEWGIKALREGGRIFYLGAGTSGRLGVLDAAECPPTFGTSPDQVIGLIAGGEGALRHAAEGAEDNREAGRGDLMAHGLTSKDLVIGLAASGRTPYVLGALSYAGSLGCHTAAISCNPHSLTGQAAELAIDIETGPEVLTGSTRLKAGTAQKMVLNMFSTAVMTGLGKVYQNLMVDVVQTNEKLKDRALRIVMEATGEDKEKASQALAAAGGRCKTAITMLLMGCGAERAEEMLRESGGHIREAVQDKEKTPPKGE